MEGTDLPSVDGLIVATSNEGRGPVACRTCAWSWEAPRARHPRHNIFWWKFLQATRLIILPPRHRCIRMVGVSVPAGRIPEAARECCLGAGGSLQLTIFVEFGAVVFTSRSLQRRYVAEPTMIGPTSCGNNPSCRIMFPTQPVIGRTRGAFSRFRMLPLWPPATISFVAPVHHPWNWHPHHSKQPHYSPTIIFPSSSLPFPTKTFAYQSRRVSL